MFSVPYIVENKPPAQPTFEEPTFEGLQRHSSSASFRL